MDTTQPLCFPAQSSVINQPQDVLLEQAKSFQPYLSSSTNDPFLVPTTEPAGYGRRAAFATTSRLLSCLVNEAIVEAYYVCYGASIVSSYILFVPNDASSGSQTNRFILSQVRHAPVLGTAISNHSSAYRVRLLDPEDLGVCQWIKTAQETALTPIDNPGQVMVEVGRWNGYDDGKIRSICNELESSVENQLFAYKSRGPDPDILMSTATEWEQSIVEGHATHPMYRARYAVPPLKAIAPGTNLFHVKLGFVAVPRSKLRIEGQLEELLHPLYSSADFDTDIEFNVETSSNTSSDTGASRYILDFVNRSEEFVLPVHPLHMPAVLSMFSFARSLPFSVPAEAQASLRTVCPKAFALLGYDIKLPLGIKVSSALRTISPWSTFVGPRITMVIPHILSKAPVADALLIAGEPASAVSNDPNFDIAKYLSCVIRSDPEHICRLRNERVILAAALTGYDDHGVSVVVKQWGLDSPERRIGFLESYVDKLFDAFLPPIMNHGFAFESHPQNSLLRIDAETGDIRGFIVRDFGGVKVHRQTFTSSTGAAIDMLPDSCTDAKSLYEVYDLAYHTLIQCQIHRLVRALDLHYCGKGWSVVRRSFERRVPQEHPLYIAWYQDHFDLKCFVTMKLDNLYRDYIYKKVPNILFYTGENRGVVYPAA
ncbi:hypothetical protein FB645_001494 [Coemansia sp. IMI 203386]|nr:hypothetical protein FB645_001494 [Coemansia sp. IMI 203386]